MINAMDFPARVAEGNVNLTEHIESVLEDLRNIDARHHMMSAISEDLARAQAKKLTAAIKGKKTNEILKKFPLLGLSVSLKDAICLRGVSSAASSGILRGYTPLFDATVVERVKKSGGIIIGKTTQDEFGFGSFSINVGKGFQIPNNPHDTSRCCGGSSGGAGALTAAADFPHISLGESTGGSIAAPAAFCKVLGLSPTYGLIPRYGLIDYGNSLDKIGPMALSMDEIRSMLNVIEGYDNRDATSLKIQRDLSKNKVNRIGIIKECFGEGIQAEVSKKVRDTIVRLEDEGIKCEEISMPLAMTYAVPAYYIIAMSEASTNLARYCGMRYGHQEDISGEFDDYFSKIRSTTFGKEAKRRIILGTFARMAGFRESYYVRALQVRSKIIDEYKLAFKKYDALISPSMPVVPLRFEEIEKLSPIQHFMMDILLVGPNLSGLPHLSVPCPTSKPIGSLLIADHLKEEVLLTLGEVLSS